MNERFVQLGADLCGEFRTAQYAGTWLCNIHRAVPMIQNAIHRRFDPLRFYFQAKGFAQEQRRRKNGAKRASHIFTSERRSRTVNRLVKRGRGSSARAPWGGQAQA